MTHTTSGRPRRMPIGAARGLSLIEALVAIAVAALLTASAAPSLGDFVQGRRIDGAAAHLAGDLQLARAETLLRSTPVRLSFFDASGGSCYLVHTGAPGTCTCLPGSTGHCAGTATAIKTVSLPASGHVRLRASGPSIAFDPLHGTCTPTGTVNLTSDSGRAVRHVVNILGRVRTCTPAMTPGYPAC